jgi:hypothetical protein
VWVGLGNKSHRLKEEYQFMHDGDMESQMFPSATPDPDESDSNRTFPWKRLNGCAAQFTSPHVWVGRTKKAKEKEKIGRSNVRPVLLSSFSLARFPGPVLPAIKNARA